tara:strand:+ start:12732 stop:14303 length:1572 start_codon:yes stop_codon:yes gene_type:complete
MITAIINARTTSERLFKKHLYKIGNKTILEHIIDKLKTVKKIEKIYFATSSKEKNIEYVKFLKSKYKKKINFFYYSKENDVTGRVFHLTKKIKTKYTLTISGDCPLIDTKYINRIYKKLSENSEYDFIYPKILLIHEGIKLFKTSSWNLINYYSREKIFRENPGFIVKEKPDKFKILEYKPLKYEIKKKKIRYSVDTISDLEFLNFINLELQKKKLSFEIQNVLKIKKLPILNSHVLQRNPYDKKRLINLITIYNSSIGYGHYKRILALKRELQESYFCKINTFLLNKNKSLKKILDNINKKKQLAIIDLPVNVLEIFVKKISYHEKIIIIDKILNNKKFTYIIPNLINKRFKKANIFSGLDKLILNRSINFQNTKYINNNKNIKKLLMIGASYSIDNEILDFMKKNKKDLKILIGPLVKKKKIRELKKQNYNLIVNQQNIFEIIKRSQKIYSRFGISVFETIALKKKPIVFSKYNTKDKKIIFELEKKNLINIYNKKYNKNLKSINIDKCYKNIKSIIEKKL